MDPSIAVIVTAVLAIVNGAIAIPIVNLLKKLLHINGGWQAFALTIAETAAVTAGYLILIVPPFTWPVFIAATFYAVLQATKIYDESPRLHPV